MIVRVDTGAPSPPDPFALAELSRDVRPSDYAVDFARLAMTASSTPFAIVAKARPDWLQAVAEEVGAPQVTMPEALGMFARRG